MPALGSVAVWKSPVVVKASPRVYIFVQPVGWEVPAAPHANVKVCSLCSVVAPLDFSCSVCPVYLSINVCASNPVSPCRAPLDPQPSPRCSLPAREAMPCDQSRSCNRR